MSAPPAEYPCLEWHERDEIRRARWRPELHGPPPKRVQAADDTIKADDAYKLISQGTALVWRGDFHNARQLLKALSTRVERRQKRDRQAPIKKTPTLRHRLAAPQGDAFCLGSGPAAKNAPTPRLRLAAPQGGAFRLGSGPAPKKARSNAFTSTA